MFDNPIFILIGIAAGIFFFHLWLGDLQACRRGEPRPQAFPGATTAPRIAVIIAAIGALVIIALETAGEHLFGFAEEQSTITWLFSAYTLVAAFTEELIFRGFIVVERRGRAMLIGSILFFSLIFAAIHPFLWEWTDEGLVFNFTAHALFSTTFAFTKSLWFYAVRFLPVNPRHSLIPCIAAHLASNIAVILIKFSLGFVSGLY